MVQVGLSIYLPIHACIGQDALGVVALVQDFVLLRVIVSTIPKSDYDTSQLVRQ
jgi:hypothetical protein